MTTTRRPFPLNQLASERGLRLFRDPCYDDAPRADKEWFLELRGRRGVLYGNNETSFWVDTTSGMGPVFSELGPIRETVSSDGREARFLFDVSALNRVLDALQPRTRRRLSPEHRKKLVESGVAFRRFSGSK